MPTDAKCGLLVGVGLVVAVAVLFFQNDPAPVPSSAKVTVPVASQAAAVKPPAESPGPERSLLAPGPAGVAYR